MICEHCRRQFTKKGDGNEIDLYPGLTIYEDTHIKQDQKIQIWLCDNCQKEFISLTSDLITNFIKLKKRG